MMTVEWKWNQWDRIDINQPTMKLGELIDFIEEKYDVDVVMLSAGVTIIFTSMMPMKKANVISLNSVESMLFS